MDILTIVAIVWVLFVSSWIIKRDKKRGVVVLTFIIVGLMITTFAKKFGYREDIIAIILSILFLIGLYFYDKKKK